MYLRLLLQCSRPETLQTSSNQGQLTYLTWLNMSNMYNPRHLKISKASKASKVWAFDSLWTFFEYFCYLSLMVSVLTVVSFRDWDFGSAIASGRFAHALGKFVNIKQNRKKNDHKTSQEVWAAVLFACTCLSLSCSLRLSAFFFCLAFRFFAAPYDV